MFYWFARMAEIQAEQLSLQQGLEGFFPKEQWPYVAMELGQLAIARQLLNGQHRESAVHEKVKELLQESHELHEQLWLVYAHPVDFAHELTEQPHLPGEQRSHALQVAIHQP